MTIKKTNGSAASMEWTLDLPSQEDLQQKSLQAFRLAREGQRVLNKEEQRIANEGNKQLLVIEYHKRKLVVAVQDNQETHDLSGRLLYETAVHHDELLQASVGTAYEGVMRQIVQYDLQSMIRQNQQLVDVYNLHVVTELAREVYKQDEPQVITKEVLKDVIVEVPQKGVFRKLFG